MHHPADMAVQTTGSGSISPFTWMILIAVFVIVGYFIYRLFNRGN